MDDSRWVKTQPGFESVHALCQPRQVFGREAPAQPACGLGRKGFAGGQTQPGFGHQAFGRLHRIRVPVEPEKRAHAANGPNLPSPRKIKVTKFQRDKQGPLNTHTVACC